MGQPSRPAMLTPWGKSDTRMQTMVPEVVRLDALKLCAQLHCTESQLLRTLVLQRLYGDDMAEALHVEQYRSMVGKRSGTEGDASCQ